MLPSADSTWFNFRLDGGGEFAVYAFSGFEEVHRPYEFIIELVSASANEDITGCIGKNACLSITDRNGSVRPIHGLVAQMEQLHTSNRYTHYRCTIVPRLWFLDAIVDHRIFQKKSVVEIYETLAFNKDCLPGRQALMNVLDELCAALGADWYTDISDSIVGLCGCGSGFAAADALGQHKFVHYQSAKSPTAAEPKYEVFEYNCATFAVEIAARLWGIPVSLEFYHPQHIQDKKFHALAKPYSYTSIIRGRWRTLDCPCASST
jgi:hypothetical protein